MPSPFPGMDPYLEGSDWRSVHAHLSVEIARYLAPKLQPKYFVRAERDYILEVTETELEASVFRPVPDVAVSKYEGASVAHVASATAGAVLEAPIKRTLPRTEDDSQVVIHVYDTKDRTLVTAIEVLSKTNKMAEGRYEYLAKRRKYLRSPAHLMEIDLLRKGLRVPLVEPLPEADYFIVLSRADQRPQADVWPVGVRSPLPIVPLPLSNGDQDVPLDLQLVLNSMYDAFCYGVELNYHRPPDIPLNPPDAAWAAEQIQSWQSKQI